MSMGASQVPTGCKAIGYVALHGTLKLDIVSLATSSAWTARLPSGCTLSKWIRFSIVGPITIQGIGARFSQPQRAEQKRSFVIVAHKIGSGDGSQAVDKQIPTHHPNQRSSQVIDQTVCCLRFSSYSHCLLGHWCRAGLGCVPSSQQRHGR